ncbi:hypothetical protein [Streptomyces sp. NPDC054975]
MDAGDWIASVAVAVSVAAAGISTHQARTARSAAIAAEEQVRAAKEANLLTRQQMDRQDEQARQQQAEADAAAIREAEKVHIDIGGGGGSIRVTVTNHGTRPIANLRIMDVRAAEPGPWVSWGPNRNVGGTYRWTVQALLHPTQKATQAVWLLNDDGQQVANLPSSVAVEARFRDDDGGWWLVSTESDPQRIDEPDQP